MEEFMDMLFREQLGRNHAVPFDQVTRAARRQFRKMEESEAVIDDLTTLFCSKTVAVVYKSIGLIDHKRGTRRNNHGRTRRTRRTHRRRNRSPMPASLTLTRRVPASLTLMTCAHHSCITRASLVQTRPTFYRSILVTYTATSSTCV